jgi:hypothetical protein
MKCAADEAVILKGGLSVEGADPGEGQGVQQPGGEGLGGSGPLPPPGVWGRPSLPLAPTAPACLNPVLNICSI